ncbi:hypothetical protein P6144_00390 [Sphingomonas sp. HITSZ_GF]|uniref:hypothetical protein n=1 Tax=Sphingomonas sp. HITSZ_GF TaxID=3037247 RepID=UPI00240E1EB8|nr:hypothetical protein [Sphingomonas sp. HITSZ_GF]MDG2532094.1 hypothetical protein [Sphingomonas sp. HITSZ_GF]
MLATLLNQGITQWRDWIGRRENAKLSAMYAVTFLLDYFEQCATRRGDKDTFISSDGHAGVDWGGLPDLDAYPEDIDWKRIGLDLTERMFAFRVRIKSAGTFIADQYDFNPPDGGDGSVFEYLTSEGLEALSIARAISKRHGLRLLVSEEELSSEGFLIETEAERVERIRAWIESNAQKLPAIHGPVDGVEVALRALG